MATTNFSGKGKVVDANLWEWAEIYWSNADPADWVLGKYTCPTLEEYKLEGRISGVDALPEDKKSMSLQEIYHQVSTSKNQIDVDLYDELVKRGKEFREKKGFICSAVKQWVILEICPVQMGADSESYPKIDVWGFLQPREIGNKKKMDENLGYVIDDIPRGGWFHAEIVHVNAIENGKYIDTYNPYLFVYEKNGNVFEKVQKGKVLNKVVNSIDITKRHGQLKKPRYLLKFEIVVRNVQTEEDTARKNTALVRFAIEKKLTEDNIKNLLRFETGSYLKIWARNSSFGWDDKCAIKDDESESNMIRMQKLDGVQGDKAIDETFKNLSPMDDDKEDQRYKYEDHYFRPFSYRNHIWKRNRFSMSGKYEEGKWYYIGLWPVEVIDTLEKLEITLLKKNESNRPVTIAASTMIYALVLALIYKLISEMKKNAQGSQITVLQKMIKFAEFPKLAAIFSWHGFPKSVEEFSKWNAGFAGECSKDLSLQFLFHFYSLMMSLLIDVLKSGEKLQTDYKGYLSKREKSWDFSALESEIKLSSQTISILKTTAKFEKKLGGSTFPPPYLMWLAWTLSVKTSLSAGATIGLKAITPGGDAKIRRNIAFSFDFSGDSGLYLDMGAVWTLAESLAGKVMVEKKPFSQNQREYVTAPVIEDSRKNFVAVSDEGKLVASKTGFQFADSIAKIFEIANLQIGAAAKFEIAGKFGFNLDPEGWKIKWPKTPNSLVISANIPLYMKLSLLTKELKALRCDLLTLTPSAVAAFPNGLYLGNSKVWNGTPELKHVFKIVAIDKKISFEDNSKYKSVYLGQAFSTVVFVGKDSIGIKESLKENEFVPVKHSLLNLYLLDGGNKIPVECTISAKNDMSNVEGGYDTVVRFDSKINITNELIKSETNLNFLKNVIDGRSKFQVELCYANDPGMVYNTGDGKVNVCFPIVRSFKAIPYSPENSQVIPNLVKVTFCLENCFSDEIPLYCHLFQADITDMIRLKNRNRENGIFLCKNDPLNSNQWFFMIKPNEFQTKKVAFGLGDEEISFKISFDADGKFPLEVKECLRDDNYIRKFNKDVKNFVKPFKWPK